jgi:iron-sulfur cluster assembly protein
MLKITEKAISAFKEKISKTNYNYIRVGVQSSGCVGYKYVIRYENECYQKDILYNFADIKIVIDKKSANMLNESTIDFKNSILKQEFIFENPNQDSTCSCGKSFSLKQNT